MQHSTTVLESQADWLTFTVQGARNVASVGARIETIIRAEKVHGNRVLPFTLGNYSGVRCGRVRSGESADRILVQLSGDLAAVYFDYAMDHAHHVTRLDLAVTVQLAEYSPMCAFEAYKAAVAHRTEHPTEAAPSLILNGAGGQTMYVGKRTGDRYFRLYDKQAECAASKDDDATERYARSWRYELEVHDDLATAVAYSVPRGPSRGAWISAYVHKYLLDHGVEPMFTPMQPAQHVGGFRRRADRESRLDWLSRDVAPTVRWLLDSTPKDELLKRLGLGEGSE